MQPPKLSVIFESFCSSTEHCSEDDTYKCLGPPTHSIFSIIDWEWHFNATFSKGFLCCHNWQMNLLYKTFSIKKSFWTSTFNCTSTSKNLFILYSFIIYSVIMWHFQFMLNQMDKVLGNKCAWKQHLFNVKSYENKSSLKAKSVNQSQ